MTVGDRRFPGAIILGGESVYFFLLPSSACPADWSRTFRRIHLWTVYEMACFQGSELLRQPLPSSTSLRRRYDVAASIPPVVAAPVILVCRDLLHSALASGHLCQVRATRHCSFLDSVLELLTDVSLCLRSKKQGVAYFVTDLWLAPAGLRGGSYWRRVHVHRRQPPSPPPCLRCSPGLRTS